MSEFSKHFPSGVNTILAAALRAAPHCQPRDGIKCPGGSQDWGRLRKNKVKAGAAEGTGKPLWGSSAEALSPQGSRERPIEVTAGPRALRQGLKGEIRDQRKLSEHKWSLFLCLCLSVSHRHTCTFTPIPSSLCFTRPSL